MTEMSTTHTATEGQGASEELKWQFTEDECWRLQGAVDWSEEGNE